MSDLGPCPSCGTPFDECPVPLDESEWVTDVNGDLVGVCCQDCHHPGTYSRAVNAPLSDVTVAALRARLVSGDYPVRRVAVRPPVGVLRLALPRYPSQRTLAVRDRLERMRRIAWEDRLREWMSCHVTLTAAGYPHYDPPAPDRTPQDQRWANWFAYTDDEALYVAQVRSYGCRCVYPLLGWTMKHDSVDGWAATTPRCRTCNAEAS